MGLFENISDILSFGSGALGDIPGASAGITLADAMIKKNYELSDATQKMVDSINNTVAASKASTDAYQQSIIALGDPYEQLNKKYKESNDLATAEIILDEQRKTAFETYSAVMNDMLSNSGSFASVQWNVMNALLGGNKAFNQATAECIKVGETYDAVAAQTGVVNEEISGLTEQVNNNTVSEIANSDAISNSANAMITKMVSGQTLTDSEIANAQAMIDSGNILNETQAEQLQSYINAQATAKDESTGIFDQWTGDLATLAERGVSDGILQTLDAAGPEAAALVQALVNASEGEIANLNTSFLLYTTSAVDSMKGKMGEEATVKAGADMMENVATNTAANTSFLAALVKLVADAKTSLLLQVVSSNFASIGATIIGDIVNGLNGAKETLLSTAAGIASSLKSALTIHASITATASGRYASVDVQWYKTGAIFNSPSIIGVGEAGPEAVIPINKLGGFITGAMQKMGIDFQAIKNKSNEFAGASLRGMTGGLFQSVANAANAGGNTQNIGPIVIQQPVKTPAETARAIKREMVMLLG